MAQSSAEIPLQVRISPLLSSKFVWCKIQPARPNRSKSVCKGKAAIQP